MITEERGLPRDLLTAITRVPWFFGKTSRNKIYGTGAIGEKCPPGNPPSILNKTLPQTELTQNRTRKSPVTMKSITPVAGFRNGAHRCKPMESS